MLGFCGPLALRFYKQMGRQEGKGLTFSLRMTSWKKDFKIYVGIPSFLEGPTLAQSLDLTAGSVYLICA